MSTYECNPTTQLCSWFPAYYYKKERHGTIQSLSKKDIYKEMLIEDAGCFGQVHCPNYSRLSYEDLGYPRNEPDLLPKPNFINIS